MKASSAFLLMASLAGGCRSPEPDAAPRLLREHVADARSATAGQAGPGYTSLTEFEAKLLAIRDDWQKRLGAPATLLTFYDFATPSMARLRKQAQAEDFAASLGKRVTLPRILAGAFVRSPQLRAAHKELAATIEQYSQVTYLDTILRQYVSFLRTLQIQIGPTLPMDQVQKRFPFPGTLELKAALVGHAVEAARAQYQLALRDLVTEVRVGYAQYVYLAQAIAITDQTLAYLRQLEATVRGKLAAGRAQKAHVLQTQVEISQLENDLITLRQQRESSRARLDTLLDLPAETPLAEPAQVKLGLFPESLDPLYARANREQPEIVLAQARADRMAAMIELAEQATYPELSAGLWSMEGISHATAGSQKQREPFSTKPRGKPDPWFGSKEAYLREAREAERGARAKTVAARDKTAYQLKQAYVQLDTAKRLFELYRDVQLSQAQQAYGDTAAAYAADRVEFLNVIDALRRWLRFLLDADRALRDYHVAHAKLESALGGPVAREAN